MSGEEKTVADEATDDALSQAWDEEVKGVKKEEVKEEVNTETETEGKPPVEEPARAEAKESDEEEVIDHKESSKLGRKFKGLESRFDQILARLDQIGKPETKQEPIEEPEFFATREDLDKYFHAKEQRSKQERSQYEQAYIQQIQKFEETNEDLHEEIFAEMMQNYNVKHSSNALSDARVNYAEAKASVLQRKVSSKPKVPTRDRAETAPVQPAASSTRTAAKTFAMPKLDAQAQSYVDYLRRSGMSDEDIAKELAS